MINERVAREYAEALFGAAEDKDKVEEVTAEMKTVIEIIFEAEFREFFLAPNIEVENKKLVFNKAVRDLNPLVRNFFWIVFDHKREEQLPVIADEFDRLVDEYRRRV
ncbi:MAG: ATP synthase F1 subunit delta, partial [Chloroflexi bacterium]|nr:ATP synthase F1 subunit delta [Chloroflexota bacterium]